MATLRQRLGRTLNSTSIRFLRANLRFKKTMLPRANCIFITALPKSGSTLLTVMAAEASGYLQFFLGDDHLNEQDLYPPKLIDSWSMNVVCHQHTRASKVTRSFAKTLRPVADRSFLCAETSSPLIPGTSEGPLRAIAPQTEDMRHDRMISGSSRGPQDATPARGLAPGRGHGSLTRGGEKTGRRTAAAGRASG